jgi:hypothetical protein
VRRKGLATSSLGVALGGRLRLSVRSSVTLLSEVAAQDPLDVWDGQAELCRRVGDSQAVVQALVDDGLLAQRAKNASVAGKLLIAVLEAEAQWLTLTEGGGSLLRGDAGASRCLSLCESDRVAMI